jgi:hypothetical protein
MNINSLFENALARCNLRNRNRYVDNIKMNISEVVTLCHNVLRYLWLYNCARDKNYLRIDTTKVMVFIYVLIIIYLTMLSVTKNTCIYSVK